MKGYVAALGLSLLLGAGGAATAATAVVDFSDETKTSNAKVVANDNGKTTPVTQADVKAVQTGGVEGNQYLYIDIQDDLFKDSKAVWVRVDYFDQGTDSFQLEYDSTGENIDEDSIRALVPVRTKSDTKVWTQQTWQLLDFGLKGRQTGGADLRINDLADGPEIISKVTITDANPENARFPKNNPAKPIAIDGKKSEGEWDGAYSVTMDRPDQDVTGGFQSKEDFSGTYSFKWDEQGLYVLGEVNDATPGQSDTPHEGQGPDYWSGDGIELFIGLDQSNPARAEYTLETDFQLVVGLGIPSKGGTEPGWGIYHGGKADAEEKGKIPASNVSVALTDTGYTFELLVPWTLLKADAAIKDGQEIGWYMFANNSRDLPSQQNQAMAPFKRPNPNTNPSRWVTALLEPPAQVEPAPTAGQ